MTSPVAEATANFDILAGGTAAATGRSIRRPSCWRPPAHAESLPYRARWFERVTMTLTITYEVHWLVVVADR